MARVLVLGAAAVDTVVRVPAFPKTDDIVFPEEVLRVPAGRRQTSPSLWRGSVRKYRFSARSA
jgi:hypothetical protein